MLLGEAKGPTRPEGSWWYKDVTFEQKCQACKKNIEITLLIKYKPAPDQNDQPLKEREFEQFGMRLCIDRM